MRPPLPRARLAAAAGLFALIVLAADRSAAQSPAKKVLTHADYDQWKAPPQDVTLSRDGTYVAYVLLPIDGPGDGEVIVRHLPTGKESRVARGGRPAGADGGGGGPPVALIARSRATAPQFNSAVTKLVFQLTPTKADIERAKADKIKAEDMPQGTLAVMELPSGEISARIPRVKGFAVGGEGAGLLIYHRQPKVEPKTDAPPGAKAEPEPFPAGPMGGKGKGGFGKGGGGGIGTAPPPRSVRTFGSDLVIRDLATGAERAIPDVDEFSLTKDGKALVYTVAARKEDTNGVFVLDPASQAGPLAVKSGPGRYSRLAWDEKQTKLAFLYDDAGVLGPNEAPPPRPAGTPLGSAAQPPQPPPRLHVYVWERNGKGNGTGTPVVPLAPAGLSGGFGAVVTAGVAAKGQVTSPPGEVVGPGTPGLRTGWAVADTAPRFNAPADKLFVQTAPVRPPAPPSPPPGSPAAADKVELDIWHWKDERIQPMQQKEAAADRSRTYAGVALLDTKEFRQLSDETVTVNPPAQGDWAVAADSRPYRHMTGYVAAVPQDVSLVNVRTGKIQSVFPASARLPSLSPDGRHLLAFDGKDWTAVSVPDGRKVNLTAKLPVKFFNEDDDHPDLPPPYGVAGWTTDGKSVLVSDRYDIWRLAADGGSAENLTRTGRQQHIRFRYLDLREEEDEDRRGIDLSKPLLLAAENLSTRDTGFFRLEPGREPRLLVMGARKYGTPVKAKAADTLLVTAQTFYDYPDYYATGPDFAELKRVTDVNPKVREYNWGRAELVHYKSADGVPLSGVLIQPENFDPSKKYPMVVYIYERLSQTVHDFKLPVAGTSINPTFYASNGYLVFMPDIAYKVGSPGQSALKCVLPAIQAVVDRGFVDEAAIGIQGHSWGGYQIAYMVTQTNRFKAAVAGAAVSDMVSAYSGIRWGTGLPRQFQYEKTQSRIGGSLWEAPMRFIENSPVFMADRVKTPVLLLHNDKDDAVPWEQGIEFFLALRRLGRECYLLNYNGEPHGLRRKANQRDYTMRMFQFFEHHLRGKPAPEWMEKGVPFLERDAEKEQFKKQ